MAATAFVPHGAPDTLFQYDLFETSFQAGHTDKNPFDAAEIQVDAVIHHNQRSVTVPCFYDGEHRWKLRYTPRETGEYTYRIYAQTVDNKELIQEGSFIVEAKANRGFVRVGTNSSRFFVFENGDSYFPIGENLGWVRWTGSPAIDEWNMYLDECEKVGINWIRIWMCPWGRTELVWTPQGDRYHGYRQYDLANARVNDQIFEEAAKRGIYIQWVINHHGQYSINHNPIWDENPYSVKNGGFLDRPQDFFTHPEAKRHYRNRLRYLVARYGYSTHLIAWEFWNEVDLTASFDAAVVKAWHEEMSSYLREIDPYTHMQTTSTSSPNAVIYSIEGMDFIQSHAYVENIIERLMADSAVRAREYPRHPHFFGELSYDYRGPNRGDKEGVILHNQLWASLHSWDCGTAMTWWWDNWVHPYNLYYHFKPVAVYIQGIHWDKENLTPVETEVEIQPGNQGTLTFTPFIHWGNTSRSEFIIQNNGVVQGLRECTRFVHGDNHRQMAPNPVFVVSVDQPVEFGMRIERVSGNGAECAVRVNGETVFQRTFAATGKDITMGEEGIIRVSLPIGDHRITITNSGRDWFLVKQYWIEQFAPRVVAYARGNADRVLVWVHDRAHRYATIDTYPDQSRLVDTSITLPEYRSGEYLLERIDTYQGERLSQSYISASASGLTFPVPSFDKDTAFRIQRKSTAVDQPLQQ